MLNIEKAPKFEDWINDNDGCMRLNLGVHLHESKEKSKYPPAFVPHSLAKDRPTEPRRLTFKNVIFYIDSLNL